VGTLYPVLTPPGLPVEEELKQIRDAHLLVDEAVFVGYAFEEDALPLLLAGLEGDLVNAMTNRVRVLTKSNVLPRLPVDFAPADLLRQITETLFLHLSEDGKNLFFPLSTHRI